MSGIYGIYRYDGASIDPQWLDLMRKAMVYYGPHGAGCKIDGPVGMGHLLLEVNPEDAFERQPMRCRRGLIVTSVRLDNREALLDAFEIPTSEAPQISDGHLVSLAFDRWGEDVCTHLEGDWALAAWDRRERRLLLSRDVFGMAALYYYEGKGFIAFASSLKALLVIPGIVKESDLLRLVELLVSWHPDADLTAYKGFRSLIGAHQMTVAPDGRSCQRRFWSHRSRELLRYRRDDDYVEAYLEHYTNAVKSCLRTRKPIAAELSGGRDSGSVVTMAAPILARKGRELVAYTSVPYFPPDGAGKSHLGNEWGQARATATMAGANVRHIPIDARDYSVIRGVEHFLRMHDGPSHTAGNHYWCQAVMEAYSRDGAGALLIGQMGNLTTSWSGNGSALLALRRAEASTALRLFLHGEPNPWLVLKRQILKPLLMPGKRVLRSLRARGRSWTSYSALNIKLAAKLDLEGRMLAAGHDPTFTPTPFDDLREMLLRIDYGTGVSITSEASAWYSVPRLDPTANLSLVEFLLRVPDDQFYRKGQSNFLFKRAFKDRMPEPVLAQKRKGLQAADLGHRIVNELPVFRECLSSLESVPEAGETLDLPLLDRCLAELVVRVDPDTTAKAVTILVRGLGVGVFLRSLAESGSLSTQVNHL